MKISEFQIQRDFHNWCKKQSFVIESWSVPNGFKASPQACQMMKLTGLHNGVCDYWFILQNGIIGAIEFKTDTGQLSKQQVEFINNLKHVNIPVKVCRSTFDAVNFVKKLFEKDVDL